MPDSKEKTLKLSDFLCFALYSTHHAMHRINKAFLEDFELTYPQFLILVTLTRSGKKLKDSIACFPNAMLQTSGMTIDEIKALTQPITDLRKQLINNAELE